MCPAATHTHFWRLLHALDQSTLISSPKHISDFNHSGPNPYQHPDCEADSTAFIFWFSWWRRPDSQGFHVAYQQELTYVLRLILYISHHSSDIPCSLYYIKYFSKSKHLLIFFQQLWHVLHHIIIKEKIIKLSYCNCLIS